MFDVLSRLAIKEYRPEPIIEVVNAHNVIDCYPVALLELSNEFKQRIIESYQRGPFKRIINTLKLERENASPVKLLYRFRDGLFYLKLRGRGVKLYILKTTSDKELHNGLEREVFRLTHDLISHPGYNRTYERLAESIHIMNLSKKLHEWIRHCPQCQINQTTRHRLYKTLQLIILLGKPFHTLTMDFILALFTTKEEFNCILTITDKFSKVITLLLNKKTYLGLDWVNDVLDRLHLFNWGILRVIISDRDSKFLG